MFEQGDFGADEPCAQVRTGEVLVLHMIYDVVSTSRLVTQRETDVPSAECEPKNPMPNLVRPSLAL